MQLQNKVVVITGASSGIGEELAKQLANEGCKLALLARRDEKLSKLKSGLSLKAKDIKTFKCDVSNHPSVKETTRKIIDHFGKVDIAILNAGVSFKVNMNEFDSTIAEETFDTNVLGLAYFFEELLPDFKKRKEGIIVGVSSLADGRGFPNAGIYSASKAAATIFLESQRISLKKFGIKVITVKPGFVKTPMTKRNKFPMPFLMDVEKASKIIIKGIKKEKNIIQFPWQTVLGAKIFRLMPDALFNFVALKNTK
ncbi:MAG: SDR family NAD(P)-dependent oxidoreductase [Ignavibacteriaceae bacterium]